eukprot:9049845-Ditylum_brightwellii.AAC.1
MKRAPLLALDMVLLMIIFVSMRVAASEAVSLSYTSLSPPISKSSIDCFLPWSSKIWNATNDGCSCIHNGAALKILGNGALGIICRGNANCGNTGFGTLGSGATSGVGVIALGSGLIGALAPAPSEVFHYFDVEEMALVGVEKSPLE